MKADRPSSSPELTDADLIAMIQRGGHERRRAVNALYDRFFYMVDLKLREHRVLDEEDVLDAYSEAVIALDRAIFEDKFKQDARIKTFFTSIMNFKIIDQVRRKSTNEIRNEEPDQLQTVPDEEEGEPAEDPLPGDTYRGVISLGDDIEQTPDDASTADRALELAEELVQEDEERRRRYALLLRAMDELNEKHRRLLIDEAWGYDAEELMEIHGFKTKRVVSTTLYTARQKLIAIVARLREEGEL